jgi:hypothetical protein
MKKKCVIEGCNSNKIFAKGYAPSGRTAELHPVSAGVPQKRLPSNKGVLKPRKRFVAAGRSHAIAIVRSSRREDAET